MAILLNILAIMEIEALKYSIATLKRGNNLMQQVRHIAKKGTRRLEIMTRHIYELQKENASRYCQQKIELVLLIDDFLPNKIISFHFRS